MISLIYGIKKKLFLTHGNSRKVAAVWQGRGLGDGWK